MGNCQATESSTVVIEHAGGRVERMHFPVSASEVMKRNPGHHVALITFFFSKSDQNDEESGVRVTRIKLLKPNDTLLLGHVYRLVSSQEVAKAVRARKYEKMMKKEQMERQRKVEEDMKDKIAEQEKDQQRNIQTITTKTRQWKPSLQSISEIAS
ncbi:hypothetical protein IHE45_03G054800 [Dioscorea alata]|uniref:Uncharacterized protein n=1 Tax=Dioscorea alata TaxID=55571 RepID=A0ACB7WL69_DIOAL|nr:hypothetical protein IHE45_03G054800 [Dioscorea alata]